MKLKPNEKIDVKAILKDLEYYHPKRRGWVWREKKDIKIGDYSYKECSDSLKIMLLFQQLQDIFQI